LIDAAVIALRLVQYVTGSILLGSALFLVYGLPREDQFQRWASPLLVSAALTLAASALAGLAAQTITLAGSVELGLTRESLQAMIATSLGTAALVRTAAAIAAVPLLLFLTPRRGLWIVTGLLGGVGVASFAWMGHGAATEGAGAGLHLFADMAHALAAGIWIGALIGFVMLLLFGSERETLRTALSRFSAVGVPLVVLLVATGLVNSWFLVGLDNLGSLLTTDYGRLLLLKLALFAVMLVLAGLNRWRHTEAISSGGKTLAALRATMLTEALLGVFVLATVAWFGMLEPLAS
jgi:putative copper resistance protein D